MQNMIFISLDDIPADVYWDCKVLLRNRKDVTELLLNFMTVDARLKPADGSPGGDLYVKEKEELDEEIEKAKRAMAYAESERNYCDPGCSLEQETERLTREAEEEEEWFSNLCREEKIRRIDEHETTDFDENVPF